MAHLTIHNPASRPFDWAEPLICEQVLQSYWQADEGRRELDRIIALHTKMWLALIDGDAAGFESRRADLARLAIAASLPKEAIDQANRAVLLELILVVVTRFRNSDRTRLAYVERLNAALRVIKATEFYTLH